MTRVKTKGRRHEMKHRRFSESQMIEMKKEPEAGLPASNLCRKHGLNAPAFYTFQRCKKHPEKTLAIHSGSSPVRQEIDITEPTILPYLAEQLLNIYLITKQHVAQPT